MLVHNPGPSQSSRSVALAKRITALGTRMHVYRHRPFCLCVHLFFEVKRIYISMLALHMKFNLCYLLILRHLNSELLNYKTQLAIMFCLQS